MQPSIFNVRVPLRDQSDVFLMNTLTDAQIIVPPEVVSLLDSVEGRTRAGVAAAPFDAEEREALATLTELGFVVDSHEADRRALDAYFDAIRHDTSQLRLTVLTTLQCNFACGYCFQGDHDDHNRHAHKMSLETAAGRGRARRPADGRDPAGARLADVLRRRAAAQPAGRLPPRRARPRRGHRPRHPADAQHHHQRPAAHPRGRRSAGAVRPHRRQGHARRRQGGARSEAAAARRPGHLRQDRRQRPRGRRQGQDLDRRQLRRRQRRQLSGAARLPRRAGVRAADRQGQLQAGDGRRRAVDAGCGPRRPPSRRASTASSRSPRSPPTAPRSAARA